VARQAGDLEGTGAAATCGGFPNRRPYREPSKGLGLSRSAGSPWGGLDRTPRTRPASLCSLRRRSEGTHQGSTESTMK
jgi:hypothetical protein